jgi:hypothetical protein
MCADRLSVENASWQRISRGVAEMMEIWQNGFLTVYLLSSLDFVIGHRRTKGRRVQFAIQDVRYIFRRQWHSEYASPSRIIWWPLQGLFDKRFSWSRALDWVDEGTFSLFAVTSPIFLYLVFQNLSKYGVRVTLRDAERKSRKRSKES